MADTDLPITSESVLEWSRRAMPVVYPSLLETMITDAAGDDRVRGLLLTGSLARCDALPGTDIDVRYILDSTAERSFRRGLRDGVLLEQTFTTESAAQKQVEDNPMHVYAYLDGVPLYDRDGVLARLRSRALEVRGSYRTTPEYRHGIAEALAHPEDKISIALAAGDLWKATFCLATTSWQLIEGLWAANDLPLPPNGSVRHHLADLHGPEDVEGKFQRLFLGSPTARAETALELLGWVRRQLAHQLEAVR